MPPLKVVLVDDEPLARERLSRLLRELDCEVVAELDQGKTLLAWLKRNEKVDGLFLDIQMPGVCGLELLAEIENGPPVVFVTAHSDYAIRAFDSDAVDYVLKPVFKDRLERALARLRAKQVPTRSGDQIRQIATATQTQRIPVRAGSGKLLLELRKISHFEVEDEMVWAWFGGQRFRTAWTALSEVEEALLDAGLVKVQRHILLRPALVVGVRSLSGGRCKVRLPEGVELEVSRTATPKIRELLGL